jgi:uncharacterized protein (TIGR02246 family)
MTRMTRLLPQGHLPARGYFALFALAGTVVAACRPAAPAAADRAAAPLEAADVAAIRGVDSAFATAAEAGSAESMAAQYAPDASLLPPNANAIDGRDAIQKFWGGLLGAYRVEIAVVADEVEGRGDLAYARGHYTLKGTPRSAGPPPLDDRGKFLEVLRRQPDGTWRYAVDMYNSDLPLPK